MWQHTKHDKAWEIAVFLRRNGVAMGMKNRTIWVCVRGRNKRGIKDELGGLVWFLYFAELRKSGKGRGEEK